MDSPCLILELVGPLTSFHSLTYATLFQSPFIRFWTCTYTLGYRIADQVGYLIFENFPPCSALFRCGRLLISTKNNFKLPYFVADTVKTRISKNRIFFFRFFIIFLAQRRFWFVWKILTHCFFLDIFLGKEANLNMATGKRHESQTRKLEKKRIS